MSLSWGKSIAKFNRTKAATEKALNKGIEQVVDKTAAHLQFRARVLTPVDTGKAKKSWGRATKKNGKDRQVTVFNTARTGTKGRGTYYLPYVEYGTIHIRPRRFFLLAQNQAAVKQRMYMKKLHKKLSDRFNKRGVTFGNTDFKSSIKDIWTL